MVMSSGAQRLVEEVADVRVELLDGCGHCPQIERADEVARLLLALPEGVAPAAGR
jgi:pimeloyl-ACP methyl ester carboxylesterase